MNRLDADLVLDKDFSSLILQKLQDVGIWNQVAKNFFFFCREINLISLVLERADGVNCMYCI